MVHLTMGHGCVMVFWHQLGTTKVSTDLRFMNFR